MDGRSVKIEPGSYAAGSDGSIWKPREGVEFDKARWPSDFEKIGQVPVTGNVTRTAIYTDKPLTLNGLGAERWPLFKG